MQEKMREILKDDKISEVFKTSEIYAYPKLTAYETNIFGLGGWGFGFLGYICHTYSISAKKVMSKHPFIAILYKYRSLAFSKRDKGNKFERLMEAYVHKEWDSAKRNDIQRYVIGDLKAKFEKALDALVAVGSLRE